MYLYFISGNKYLGEEENRRKKTEKFKKFAESLWRI